MASHIAKTACWAHPNPCKKRKCSFAAARSSCAWRERYLHIKKLRFTRICNFSIRLKTFQANRSLPILHEVKFPFLPMSHYGALHQRYSPQYRKSLILGSTKERLFCCSLRCFCFRRTSYCFSCSTIRCWRSIIFCEKL